MIIGKKKEDMENKYKDLLFVPTVKQIKEDFVCRVPLENTRQRFIIDGVCDGRKGLEMETPAGVVEKMLTQVIAVRRDPMAKNVDYSVNINVGRGGAAKLLYCAHTLAEAPFETAENINITVGEDAMLDLIIMQNEHNKASHASVMRVDMGRSSRLRLYLISLHGGVIGNKVSVNLNGRGGEASLSGLYFGDGEQRIVTEVNVFHNIGECHSNQLFKGVLEGSSVSHFNGTVYVAKDAQKTEAYQANNNILASETAKAFTEPHLEIYADDVKCSHGATVGRLDENELFYMRSRGIELNEAILLQQQAFAQAVLDKISNEQLRRRLTDLVEKRLRGEFSKCSNCSTHCC